MPHDDDEEDDDDLKTLEQFPDTTIVHEHVQPVDTVGGGGDGGGGGGFSGPSTQPTDEVSGGGLAGPDFGGVDEATGQGTHVASCALPHPPLGEPWSGPVRTSLFDARTDARNHNLQNEGHAASAIAFA